jgi:hypothetical protein
MVNNNLRSTVFNNIQFWKKIFVCASTQNWLYVASEMTDSTKYWHNICEAFNSRHKPFTQTIISMLPDLICISLFEYVISQSWSDTPNKQNTALNQKTSHDDLQTNNVDTLRRKKNWKIISSNSNMWIKLIWMDDKKKRWRWITGYQKMNQNHLSQMMNEKEKKVIEKIEFSPKEN